MCVWEMLFRHRPFNGRSSEKLTASILNDPLKFPNDADELCSADGQNFVRSVSGWFSLQVKSNDD